MVNKKRGFTLIELLVVIAIIGILASVVLASLNTARSKGSDAAVKANLSGIRPQAELYYSDNGNAYGTLTTSPPVTCPTAPLLTSVINDSKVVSQVASAKSASGGLTSCAADTDSYAVVVQLKSDKTKAFCIDSTGKAEIVTENTATPIAYTQSSLNAEITTSGCVE